MIVALLTSISMTSTKAYPVIIKDTYYSSTIRFGNLEDFTSLVDGVYKLDMKNNKIINASEDEMKSVLKKATFAFGKEKQKLLNELKTYGIYLYEPQSVEHTSVINNNVYVSSPHIYYNAYNKTYTITAHAYWINDDWSESIIIDKSLNNDLSIGDGDTFKINFSNTNKEYKSALIDSYAFIANKDFSKEHITTNRSFGDSSLGFGFILNDYAIEKEELDYVGYNWYGSSTYDSNFQYYFGDATTEYIHTYDKWYIVNK